MLLRAVLVLCAALVAPSGAKRSPEEVVKFWTKDRRKNAIRRDITVDERTGQAYINGPNGPEPYGLLKKGKAPPNVRIRRRDPFAGPAHRRLVTTPIGTATEPHSVGRIYFTTKGGKYSCSATGVGGGPSGRSFILTAGHCTWDKRFATDVLFVPDPFDDLIDEGEDGLCTNRAIGCWTPDIAVLHADYRRAWWAHDVAFYVVFTDDGVDSHFFDSGSGPASDDKSIADAVSEQYSGEELYSVDFAAGTLSEDSTALGYPGYLSIVFNYCEDVLAYDQGDETNWWNNGCQMGGGSSGGPWVMSNGGVLSNVIFSVNSYGYRGRDGMGSTNCESGTSGGNCECVLQMAETATTDTMADSNSCGSACTPTEPCASEGDCCSSSCLDGVCSDSGGSCLPEGATCSLTNPEQCCSNVCNQKGNSNNIKCAA